MNSIQRNLGGSGIFATRCALLAWLTLFTGCGSFFVNPTLNSMKVTPAGVFVQSGHALPMTATAIYSDGKTQNMTGAATWTSSHPNVATVSRGGVVSGLITGSTTIAVSYQSVSAGTMVTVAATPLISIEVSPVTATVKAGQTLRYTATGTFGGGATENVTGNVTWTSSDTSVATVSGGVATAKSVSAIGQAQIYAGSGSAVSQPVTLVVYPQ
jgi:trimeric autotransporter adhesin